jgi:hypothetical protein
MADNLSAIVIITNLMKPHIVVLAFLLLSHISFFAQETTFEYIFRSEDDTFLNDISESSTNQVYASIYLNKLQTDSLNNSIIIHLNSFGSKIKQALLSVANKNFIADNIFVNSDNSLDIIGGFSQSINQSRNAGVALFRLDSSFIQNAYNTYNFPYNRRLVIVRTTKQPDGGYLMGAGLIYDDIAPPYRPVIYKFSPDFDSLNAKYFLGAGEGGYLTTLREIDTNFIWGLNLLYRRSQLFDKELNLLETQKWGNSIGGNLSCVWDTDTSFYLLGQRAFSQNKYALGVWRQYDPMDTTGSNYYTGRISDTVDFPALWKGIDMKHQDTLFFGGTRNLSMSNPYFANQPSWFIIVQTDSALNVRWERFYGGDAYYVMTNVLASRDGGCFVGGVRYDYQNNTEQQRDVVLLKLNSEGLLVGVNNQQSIRMHEAIVFPNPGKDEMHLRIAAQHPFSVVTLYDLGGRQVLQQSINGQEAVIRTTGLAPGTYIYELSAPTGLYETGKWVKQ